MRYLSILILCLVPSIGKAGTKAGSALVVKEYESAMHRWVVELRTAANADAQLEVWKKRPDSNEYAKRLWTEIGRELNKEWALEYASWLVEQAPVFAAERGQAAKRSPVQEIMLALERLHMKSAAIGRLCLSLTAFPDPGTLALVEKVAKESPHKEVQGQAALAIAMLLKELGDNPQIMEKRLTRLREAIIKAAHVKVGDVTVADLARDEVFVIQHLVKDREAPNIIGRDVAGAPFQLADLRGKVVVLAFWNSKMLRADHGIELLRKLHDQNKGRPMEVIGVTGDQDQVLRQLRASGTIPWRNFVDAEGLITKEYRVRRLPQVFVIDQKGIIQFVGAPGAFVDLAVEALLPKR